MLDPNASMEYRGIQFQVDIYSEIVYIPLWITGKT